MLEFYYGFQSIKQSFKIFKITKDNEGFKLFIFAQL